MHTTLEMNEITAMRRAITRPTVKPPDEAKAAFEAYVLDRYKISDLTTSEGLAFLAKIRHWEAMRILLDYMGYPHPT